MTTQTAIINTQDYGSSLSTPTLRNYLTDTLIVAADSANEVTADSGRYALVFTESAVHAAGWYGLRAFVSGAPINRFVYFTGVDGETAVAVTDLPPGLPQTGQNIVTRPVGDDTPITFSFPVASATLTGTRRINNAGSTTSVSGALSFLRTSGTRHLYSLAYNAADRPSDDGVVEYVFTDGTYSRTIVLKAVTAVLDSASRVKLDGTQPDYAPLLASGYTAPANADITAIKAKTDNLPSDPADQSLVIAATDAVMTRLGTPAGVSVSADIASVKTDTGTTIPAQITGLHNLSSAQVVSALGTGTWATAIPWNSAWDAEVQSEVQDAIEVNNLDHLVKIEVDTNFATTVHLNSVIGHMADNGTTATFSRTTDSLEAIRDNQTAGSGASLPDIIAGVQSVSGAIIEAQNSATLSIRIGDTWTQDIESLGDLTDKTVSFALKKRASDADTAAIVFIVEGTGLTKLNGAAATAGWGSITILDEVAGDIRLRLESNATSLLTSGSYVDAVKVLENGDDRTLRNAGRTVVSAGVIADIT